MDFCCYGTVDSAHLSNDTCPQRLPPRITCITAYKPTWGRATNLFSVQIVLLLFLMPMTCRLFVAFSALILAGTGCKTTKSTGAGALSVTLTEEGLLTCFPASTLLRQQPVWCEASAVVFDGTRVLLANDKDMPDNLSPVFSKLPGTLPDSTQPPTYLTAPAYKLARKYEDFAQTPDRKFTFLTTAFDRVKADSPDWDGYNTLLYWRTGDEQNPIILTPDDSSRTSIAYRTNLARALADDEFPGEVPYFKVEGLAATNRLLLFGIREMGRAYNDFKPVNKIITVSYRIVQTPAGERIRLADDWRVVANFNAPNTAPDLPKPLSLSSLEYDPVRNRFWLLTSLETPDRLDAYLWHISADDLLADKPFTLVRDGQGQPLHFSHKAEDLTFLDRNQLLIIHDDDRFQLPVGGQIRQPNQAPYSIVTIR